MNFQKLTARNAIQRVFGKRSESGKCHEQHLAFSHSVLMRQTGATYLFINVQKLVSASRRAAVATRTIHLPVPRISALPVYFILQTYSAGASHRCQTQYSLFATNNQRRRQVARSYIAFYFRLHHIRM